MTQPQPLRIAIVSLQFLPRIGGAEMQALKLAQALQGRGHTVHIYTLRYANNWAVSEAIAGVPMTRLGGVAWGGRLRLGWGLAWINYLAMARALWRARRALDVIHVTQISPWAGVAALIGKLAHKPVFVRCSNTGPEPDDRVQEGQIVWLYPGTPTPDQPWRQVSPATWVGGDISNLKRYWPSWMPTIALLRGPQIHAIGTTQRMLGYLARQGFPPERTHLLPNITPAPDAPAEPAHALTVTCVARHSYEKGVDVLLYAWQMVHQALPAARLQLVGTGPLTDALQQLAKSLDLGDSVVWLGKRQDVADILHRATVFVLPSRWEGLPNALLEAMAHGLPCVATRVSGAEDVIHDGATGLLVPPLNPAALAGALLRFLREPDLARDCGTAARCLVQNTLNPAMLAAQYEELCARAMQTESATPLRDALTIPEE